MGPQAQLETREFSRGGVLGVGGVKMVEIIATLELDESKLKKPSRQPAEQSPRPAAGSNGSGQPRPAAVQASQGNRQPSAQRQAIAEPEPEPALTEAPRKSSINAYNAARKDTKPP